jgi:hypothetical protein
MCCYLYWGYLFVGVYVVPSDSGVRLYPNVITSTRELDLMVSDSLVYYSCNSCSHSTTTKNNYNVNFDYTTLYTTNSVYSSAHLSSSSSQRLYLNPTAQLCINFSQYQLNLNSTASTSYASTSLFSIPSFTVRECHNPWS